MSILHDSSVEIPLSQDTDSAFTHQRTSRLSFRDSSRSPFLIFFDAIVSCLSSCLDVVKGFIASSSSPQVIHLNGRALTVLKQLGEGGFSFVYLVRENGNYGDLKALKRIRIQLPEHEERIASEIKSHKSVQSPHIIPLLDSTIRKDLNGRAIEGLLLLPFYKNGTIQDLIDRTPLQDYIPLTTILRLTIGICKGLMALHSLNPPLAFRDLKPANVLLNDNGDAILMDLGSVSVAKVVLKSRREAVLLQDLCAETVTAPFRAPELFDPPSVGAIDESTDVWALGCTVYAMAFRQSPFDGSMTAAVSGKLRLPSSNNPYDTNFCSFLEWMIQTDPSKRPKVQEIQSWCEAALSSRATKALP